MGLIPTPEETRAASIIEPKSGLPFANPNRAWQEGAGQQTPTQAPAQPRFASVNTTQQKQPATEPAVISSDGIDSVIAKNNTTHEQLSNKGTYQGQDGALRYSDGSLVPAPMSAESADSGMWTDNGKTYGAAPKYLGETDDPETQQMNDLFASLKSSLDSSTKKQIDAIEQQHAVETQMQSDANARAGKARTSALLTARTSRNAPFAASGTSLAQTTFGLQQLQAIDARENAALASVEKAKNDGNQQLVDKALGYVQDIRTQKQEVAQKILDAQQQRIEASQKQQVKASRDSAIQDLMAQGVTDPGQMLNFLNFDENGTPTGDFTAEEVKATMDALLAKAPPGVADLVKTLQQNGAPADVVQKVLGATSMSDAYKAAGDYAAGGSGIIGEYNYYRAQAKAAGQVPIDFDPYKTYDENRKAKAAATGDNAAVPPGSEDRGQVDSNGLYPDVLTKLTPAEAATVKMLTNYAMPLPAGFALKAPYFQKLLGAAAQYDPTFDATQYNVRLNLKKDFTSGKAANNIKSLNTAISHLNTLNEAVKGLKNSPVQLWNQIKNSGFTGVGDPRVTKFTAAATAVESELANVFKGTGATDQEIKAWRDQLNTSQSPAQLHAAIDQSIELMSGRMHALQSQYETGLGKPKDFHFLSPGSRKILKGLGIDAETIDPASPLNKDTGDTLVQNEKGAQDAVLKAVKLTPTMKDQVRALLGGTFKGVDHPLSYSEVQQYLQATGKMQ